MDVRKKDVEKCLEQNKSHYFIECHRSVCSYSNGKYENDVLWIAEAKKVRIKQKCIMTVVKDEGKLLCNVDKA